MGYNNYKNPAGIAISYPYS